MALDEKCVMIFKMHHIIAGLSVQEWLNLFTQMCKFQPHGGARRKVIGSGESWGYRVLASL